MKIKAGAWRDGSGGPIEGASGLAGKERVHFQAPPAKLLKGEVQAFPKWFNKPADIDAVLKPGWPILVLDHPSV